MEDVGRVLRSEVLVDLGQQPWGLITGRLDHVARERSQGDLHALVPGGLITRLCGVLQQDRVILENSNMVQLASNRYRTIHSLPQEDRYETDDASAGQVYAMVVSTPSLPAVQSARYRQHDPSLLDRQAQAY